MTTTDYLRQQQAEITEHYVYSGLSKLADNEHNRITLKKIADDELKHYYIWKKNYRQGCGAKQIKSSPIHTFSQDFWTQLLA